MPGESEVGNLEAKGRGVKVGLSADLFEQGCLFWIVHFVEGQRAREQQVLRLYIAMNETLSPEKL